jgi:hypothetical protein
VINVDKNPTYPPAVEQLKEEGTLPLGGIEPGVIKLIVQSFPQIAVTPSNIRILTVIPLAVQNVLAQN